LSKNQRSRKQHDGYSGSDEALIRECMARFGYSRAEAIERLSELGGI
jgi:hypothetical protein